MGSPGQQKGRQGEEGAFTKHALEAKLAVLLAHSGLVKRVEPSPCYREGKKSGSSAGKVCGSRRHTISAQ